MAKRQSKQHDSSDQLAEIDFLRIRASNETIQDALRAITERWKGSVQVYTAPPKRLTGTASSDSDATLFDGQDVIDGEAVVPNDKPGSETTEEQPRRRTRGDGQNRDRNAGLAIVKSLNLHPDEKESLKHFVAAKRPKTQEEHIAVFIYYLKNVIEESKVGFSHIYTCFKEIGKRMPADLPQSCRNAGSTKGWIDTSTADDLKRTTRGDNFVENDLPRAAASGDDGAK